MLVVVTGATVVLLVVTGATVVLLVMGHGFHTGVVVEVVVVVVVELHAGVVVADVVVDELVCSHCSHPP